MGKTLLKHSVAYEGYLLPWLHKQTGTWYAKEAMLLKKDQKNPDTDPASGNGYNTDIN